MKVIFLASYFPKPDNPVMGTWALSQAQAIVRQGIDLQVVSFTSWVPGLLALTSGARAYSKCPSEHVWEGNVRVLYPRWLYYPVSPVRRWMYNNPGPYLSVAYWSARKSLLRIIRDFQPDVLFCHHSLPNGWVLSRLPGVRRLPVITSDYDFDEISDCIRYPLRRKALGYVTENVDLMLCAARRMERNIIDQFPHAKAKTLHHAVTPLADAMLTKPRPASFSGHITILCCAMFAERKGVPVLVEAFARVAAKYPAAILRIVGSGPDEGKIRQKISDCSLGDRVHLVGRKPHAEVLQEMIWADCFALVGWDEPFATVYLEAMAAAKAVICCNDGGINDVIQSGVHGICVPPKDIEATADALEHMLKDPEGCRRMGVEGKKLIERSLTWDAKGRELVRHFEEALAR